jgi:hypothetical protein
MLPAPLDARDRSASESAQAPLAETTADERVQHLRARNARTRRGACEQASRVLDLGKLRHECQRTPVTQGTQARTIDSAASRRRE